MIFNDSDKHHKPHVHVYYGEYEASVGLDGEVLEVLKDDLVFAAPALDHGIVTWCDGEVDCAPEFMYNHSYEYMQEPVIQ